MENYAVALDNDKIIVKDEVYPILSIRNNEVLIDVDGNKLIIPLDSKNFAFYINCKRQFNAPKTEFCLIYKDIDGSTQHICSDTEENLKKAFTAIIEENRKNNAFTDTADKDNCKVIAVLKLSCDYNVEFLDPNSI